MLHCYWSLYHRERKELSYKRLRNTDYRARCTFSCSNGTLRVRCSGLERGSLETDLEEQRNRTVTRFSGNLSLKQHFSFLIRVS